MAVSSPHTKKDKTAGKFNSAEAVTNSQQSLELRQVLRPLLRWWWALIVVPVLSGVIAFYLIQHSTHYYQARTLLNIGPSLRQLDSQAPLLVTIRLGSMYSQIVNQEYFLTTVAQQSNSGLTSDQIRQSVVAYFNTSTPFLEIQFVDSIADRAN
jgi:capsular polysaccharide biosynthesis protein